MTRILVVSDTHGDPAWIDYLQLDSYDYVIHAGDHLMSLKKISSITPYYVDGNNDWGDKKICQFVIDEYKFLLVHGDKHISYSTKGDWTHKFKKLGQEEGVNVLIFGHTHVPYLQETDELILLNPGSMSFSRHNGKKCYSEIIIDDKHEIHIYNYELEEN